MAIEGHQSMKIILWIKPLSSTLVQCLPLGLRTKKRSPLRLFHIVPLKPCQSTRLIGWSALIRTTFIPDPWSSLIISTNAIVVPHFLPWNRPSHPASPMADRNHADRLVACPNLTLWNLIITVPVMRTAMPWHPLPIVRLFCQHHRAVIDEAYNFQILIRSKSLVCESRSILNAARKTPRILGLVRRMARNRLIPNNLCTRVFVTYLIYVNCSVHVPTIWNILLLNMSILTNGKAILICANHGGSNKTCINQTCTLRKTIVKKQLFARKEWQQFVPIRDIHLSIIPFICMHWYLSQNPYI